MKAVPCHDCLLTFPPEAMDFDHVRGVKRGNVSDLVGLPTQELMAEVANCEVVCATCHRTRTSGRIADAHVDEAETYDVLMELHLE